MTDTSLVADNGPVPTKAVYCTVVAQNYLPQALALYASVKQQEPDMELVVLVVDADRPDVAEGRPGLSVMSVKEIGLSQREVLNMAAIYDVVEFSTSVKPQFFLSLLATYDQVTYLDPDTYVVSPLKELAGLVAEHGVVLTPHFLEPIPPEVQHVTEVHSLTVGIHNLGFASFGHKGVPFLEWWAAHLSRECLIYPLLGIFVDQKWTDIGANLFQAHSLRHYGYNVGPWNLHERAFSDVDGKLQLLHVSQELRLVHFSGFNPQDPDAISIRLSTNLKNSGLNSPALAALSREYARYVLEARAALGSQPEYAFDKDARGQRISKRTRRAFRKALVAAGDTGRSLPSPFLENEVAGYHTWRARALVSRLALTVGDASIAAKYALPDEFAKMKMILPNQFSWLRGRMLAASRVRR